MGTRKSTISLLMALSLAGAPGCGSDGGSKKGDGDAGKGSDAGEGSDASAGGARFEGCSQILPSTATTKDIQTALIEPKPLAGTDRAVVCLSDGTYKIEKELSVTLSNVTIRGNPKDRTAVVLDFGAQKSGDDAVSVTGDGFTIEYLTVKNTRGNSIVVQKANQPTFRGLKVMWDAGSTTGNGAYAVYPVGCKDVLVEDNEVVGASDAGIYVGQCNNVIVRKNQVHGNVAGIEIENTNDAEVYDNHTYDNTAGILVFVLPQKEQKVGSRCIVHDNVIESNNRKNFGEKGTTVSFVPTGIGALLLASDVTEVRDNDIKGNGTTGVLVVSQRTFNTICQVNGGQDCADPMDGTDPDTSKSYIHDNTFSNNGAKPDELVAGLFMGINPIENVLWDGRKPEKAPNEDQFCLGPKPPTMRVFGDQSMTWLGDRSMDITDASMFTCTLPAPFSKITLPQDK